MSQLAGQDPSQQPIVITYNNSVSITNLASIASTTANGSTDFVKGILLSGDLYKIYMDIIC